MIDLPMIEYFRLIALKRKALAKEVAQLEKEEKRLGEILLASVPQMGEITAPGITLRKIIKSKPTASDWNALYEYIRKNDAFDLLHKRLTETAVKLRWDDSVIIPGVVSQDTESLEVEFT